MATLIKTGNKYRSKIQIRIGKSLKAIYIDLDTPIKSQGKLRNEIVTTQVDKIKDEIKRNESTLNDLFNIDKNRDWSWVKQNGTRTSIRIVDVRVCVDEFITSSKLRGLRPSTIDSYTYALNRLVKIVNCPMSDFSEFHLDRFIESLKNDRNIKSDSSINSNLKSVRALLKWCERRKYIDRCPHFEFLSFDRDDKWLTEQEYNDILNYKHYSDKRFKRAFKLYGETGMRLTEGFNGVLTEDENGIWLVIGKEYSKSHKTRTIPLNEEQRNTIQMIQSLWYEKGCSQSHIKYYSKVFKNVRNALGIDRNKSFHSLRHYYGKTMVIKTNSIYYVSGLMGHHSTSVTEKYYVKNHDQRKALKEFPSLKEYLQKNENGVAFNHLGSVSSNSSNLGAN